MKLARDKRLAGRKIDGVYYLISPWDHKLHKMNDTATFILECLDKGLADNEISSKLACEFQVTDVQAKKDVQEFLALIEEKKLYTK